MKKSNILLAINFICLFVTGQSNPYDLSKVPDVVKNNASVIMHLENIDMQIDNPERISVKVHRIFSVLNEDGKDALLFNEYSSKDISLDEAEIKVYDANGKQIEKYKKKDMFTTAVGEGLIEDGYVTFRPILAKSYPITVEFKYEQTIKSTLNIPDYRFIHVKEGIVESNYTAKVPKDIELRYKGFNTSIQPIITEDPGYKMYKWTVKDLSPIEYEEGSASPKSKYPHISFVANNFSHYGFHGDLSSWKNFGLWINNLYNGLDILPANRQQFFADLTKNASTENEKIKLIYNYLQKNFRYVSIQLGIGGLRPYSAEFTDQKKYGDCKALSNYMKAALKSIGIKSHVAIINAEYNEEPVDPSFPSNDFNHVILCIPEPKDSVWLECTSSVTDFNELGSFTENRNALLITDEGGVLVSTPKSQSAANIISTTTTVTVADDMSAATETIFTTKGEFRRMISSILQEKTDEQKKFIVFYLGAKQPDDFIISKEENSDENKTKLKMLIAKLPEFIASNKCFINPRTYKIWVSKLPKSENRKFDFYFHFPFEKYDTTIFKFPIGMTPDVLPKEQEIKCDYGLYKSKCWLDEKTNSLYSTTTLILKQHKIPVADYAFVKKFFDAVMQDDSQRLVTKKQETEKKAF